MLIPAGAYGSVTVSGFCYMQGSYTILHGLTVAPGGVLDAAVFFFFPGVGTPGTAVGGKPCNVFVDVSGGVEVGEGGTLFLGNGAGTDCPASNNVVDGGLTATNATTVVVHGTTINGGMSVEGGGGGTTCAATAASPVGPYADVEDSMINGAVSLSDLSTCWMGFIRNMDNGTVSIMNNTVGDPDAIEVGLNSIKGSLACSGNRLAVFDPNGGGVPTNSFDGSPPNPNTVTGRETGQCAGL